MLDALILRARVIHNEGTLLLWKIRSIPLLVYLLQFREFPRLNNRFCRRLYSLLPGQSLPALAFGLPLLALSPLSATLASVRFSCPHKLSRSTRPTKSPF